jgi:membrane protease YdiL (CAAX protease family)
MLNLAPGQTAFDLLLVAYVVLVLPALSVRNGRAMAAAPDAPLAPCYLRMMLRGWLAAAAVGALWLFTRRPLATLGIDIPLGTRGELGLAVAAAALLFAAIVQLLLPRLMTPERRERLRGQMRAIKILPRSTLELALFLGVSLTAGVWEELVYRGFLIWFIAPYAGLIGAVVLSTLVFGIGHSYQGWRGARNAGTLGLLFAIGYALTGSLWWLIAIHALVDAFGGLLAWRALRLPELAPV